MEIHHRAICCCFFLNKQLHPKPTQKLDLCIMILKSHSNTLYLFSKYRICTFPHLTTCAHATWPLGVYRFICSLPVYHVFLLVFCSLPTLSHILNLSVTPCLSICQCYPLSSLPISPTTHPSLHHRIPATSVPNPVSQQLALNEGLWWWRWGRRRWRTWRRRVGLGLRGGVAPWEWRISALHEDRMFWTVLKARGTREVVNYSCSLCEHWGGRSQSR